MRVASIYLAQVSRPGRPVLAEPLLQAREDGMVFSNLAGVLLTADKERFARTVFRATRGNTYTQFKDIEDPLREES
jgi:hypothetical protein